MPFFGRRRGPRPGGRRRRFGPQDPLPEPDNEFDFSDDDEDDPDDDGDDGGLATAAEAFTRRTGVQLHSKLADDDDEDEAEQEAKGPVEPRLALRALPVLERTVLVYPESVRGGLLHRLHLYGRFQMRGKPFLGCAIARMRRINLAIRRRTPMPSLQRTLHHEIGHLVELHPDFPAARWEALNDHPYTGAGHRDPDGKWSGPEVWERGFVTRYAMKNRHEDFAELVELAFTEPQRARQLARHSDVLARKLELAATAYERLVPGLVVPWAR
jgi:hypothetical protein